MPGKIYLVSLNGVPKYVGFTVKSIGDRWKEHIYCSKTVRSCPALHNAINKYGTEAFTITEIYSSEDVHHTLNVMEPYFISEHNTHISNGGYNISYGGKQKAQHSEETKQKIRMAKLGTTHTEQAKEKMRKAKLGKTLSEEHKKKVGLSGKGRKHSEETKQRLRLVNLGKRYSFKKRNPLSEEHREKLKRAWVKRRLTTSQNNPNHPNHSSCIVVPNTLASSHAPVE